MITNFAQSHRLDGIDAEQFKLMIQSESFGLLRKRLEQMLEVACRRCVEEADIPTLHINQGSARTLRVVLSLPDQLLGELRSNTKA